MATETVVWILKDGAPEWQEEIFATFKGRKNINIEKVNEFASAKGCHYRRTSYINL